MKANITRTLLLSLLICFGGHSHAKSRVFVADDALVTVTKAALEHFATTNKINDAKEITQKLNELTSPIDKILATDLVLKQLQLLSPNDSQRAWVHEQLQSDDIIYTTNIDHPNQTLVLVNIAKQAQTTLHLWQVNSAAQQYIDSYQHGELLLPTTTNVRHHHIQYQAFSVALTKLNEQQLHWLTTEIKQLATDKLNPQVIAITSNIHPDPELIKQVLHLAVDEFSYQLLQQLPMLLTMPDAINILMQATENSKLSSQALLLLAKHFGDSDLVQQQILHHLQSDNLQWHAAMAAQLINHDKFTHALAELNNDKPTPATQAALSTHKERM